MKKLTNNQKWVIAEFLALTLLAIIFLVAAYVMYKEVTYIP